MPTKRGPERVQIEDHVKRIARRLIARRKKRQARGSRDDHETASKLIQFPARAAPYRSTAQARAAGPLRSQRGRAPGRGSAAASAAAGDAEDVAHSRPMCHAQTDAPYVRGRLLVIIPLGDGRFTVEVARAAESGRPARSRPSQPFGGQQHGFSKTGERHDSVGNLAHTRGLITILARWLLPLTALDGPA